jgi:pimeloyl-ACP methyl ester carboxylesterase
MRIDSFAHDGLTFGVIDTGPLDGEPVVLLHGFPERATSWDRVAPHLHAAGLRTYALDQRGYSPGARPRGRRAYTLPRLVGDAHALIQRIGSSAHVVGHDWGGGVAWSLAGRHPEAVRTLTSASTPHPAALLAAMVHSRQARDSWYMAFFQLPWLPERLILRGGDKLDLMLRKGGMDDEGVARVHREIFHDGALTGGINWYRAMPLAPPSWTRDRIAVPTTYVWSNRDFALGRWAAEHTAAWVDGDYRFVELDRVSHWIPREAPEALAREVIARVGA